MTYENALEFIYSRRKYAKSNSLERIEALLSQLGNPQNKMEFVHIVGTNGKGSVSTMIASALCESGYKTGLFTSPFVTQFCERIQLNMEYIKEDVFSQTVEEIKKACEEIEKDGFCPTFFETVLACALLYYAQSGCQIAVLEAGIGGKDDSTNVIAPPLAVVITSVSFDHVDVLGNTLEEIALSKCGVIKECCPVISFPKENCGLDFVPQQKEVCNIIEKVCKEKHSNLVYPNISAVSNISSSLKGNSFTFDNTQYFTGLCGKHQIANAMTALSALSVLSQRLEKISSQSIVSGLKKAFLPARMETVSDEPLVLLDGGHNEGCMKALAKAAEEYLSGKKITAVLAFMKDKDYAASLKIIAPFCSNIVFTLADEFRGEQPQEIAKHAKGLCENTYTIENISLAFKKAQELCEKDGAIICAGSFYCVSEIRKIFFN